LGHKSSIVVFITLHELQCKRWFSWDGKILVINFAIITQQNSNCA
jgi:hypothetical protein